jgi:hypothetical protein
MKAPSVNLKDILKKLSFLKNNLALLVPIIIAIVALLLLIPTRILAGRLRATVEEQSLRTGKRVDSLIRDVNSAAEAEVMRAYIDAYAQDVNAINAMVAHTVERELLRYDIFGPDTNETSRVLFERFGQAYRAGIDTLLESVNAGVCPARTEIQAALKTAPRNPLRGAMGGAYGEGAYGGTPYGGGMDPYGGGGMMGRGQSLGIITETDKKIFEQICLDRAKAFEVYASPADIAGYAYWNDWTFENNDKAYKDCWYWQVGYWVIEDVITSIRQMNQGAESILEAPVKRLMSAEFMLKKNRAMRGRRGGSMMRRAKDTENPTYATGIKDALTTPCTGRFTTIPIDEPTGIDVVQFDVRVIIDATQVKPFMEQVCTAKPHQFRGFYGDQPEQTYEHNQISILETSISPVETESYAHFFYRYGEMPVVELDLICEYVFDRTPAFHEIMPKQVKDELQGEEESGA